VRISPAPPLRNTARTGEKVVWPGDSGDELFGGAAEYKADRTLTVMPYNNISGDYCQCARPQTRK